MRALADGCTPAAASSRVTAGQMNARTVVSSMRLGSVLSRRLCAIAVGRYRRAYGRPSRLESLELNVRVLRICGNQAASTPSSGALVAVPSAGWEFWVGLESRGRSVGRRPTGRDTGARERARGRWIGGSLRAGLPVLSRSRRWRPNDGRYQARSCVLRRLIWPYLRFGPRTARWRQQQGFGVSTRPTQHTAAIWAFPTRATRETGSVGTGRRSRKSDLSRACWPCAV